MAKKSTILSKVFVRAAMLVAEGKEESCEGAILRALRRYKVEDKPYLFQRFLRFRTGGTWWPDTVLSTKSERVLFLLFYSEMEND